MNNITSLVRDITYFYIKYFYDNELIKTQQTTLSESSLSALIETLYIEKSHDLKKYIRDTLKDNLKEKYSSLTVENIILEMFAEPELSKHRVYLEIIEYQKNI